jgi:regulator of protease activity HflC (stomatin/prohibitin superfamily)
MNTLLKAMNVAGVGLVITGAAIWKLFFTVDGGERAILFDKFKGVKDKVYGEGMHFKIPLVQVLNLQIEVEKTFRTQKSTISEFVLK